MSRTLYLECYSGISGDMTVAALLDLGADKDILLKSLNSLNLSGFKIEISRVKKSGIEACDFKVILDKAHENHDHDMEYLHGSNFETSINSHHDSEHSHGEEHQHHVDYSHEGDYQCGEEHYHHQEEQNHIHSHEHRGLPEILNIIETSDITDRAKKIAVDIFKIIAKAEAEAHGVDINQVDFHEVGAVDSIVDIVAAAVCLDNLDITEVIIPELYEGRGTIRCQHGIMPVPVPAVVNIVKNNNLNLHMTDTEGELVTPTGAAIAAAIKTRDKLPSGFKIKEVGIGAGKRNYDRPSVLRAMIIENNEEEKDLIYKLETNIDDCSGEVLGYVMNKLIEAGARDVHYMPVFMKKNRPAYMLNVICTREDIEKMEQIIFADTTTIGIRRTAMERTVLKREIIEIDTSLGRAKVKICSMGDMIRYYPEYESVILICKERNISYNKAYSQIQREVEEFYNDCL